MELLNRIILVAALMLTIASLGCSSRLDRHWGEAQQAATARQIANPEGAATAATTLDGVAAEQAMETHRRAGGGPEALPPAIVTVSGGS